MVGLTTAYSGKLARNAAGQISSIELPECPRLSVSYLGEQQTRFRLP